jgi:hypothetical protein
MTRRLLLALVLALAALSAPAATAAAEPLVCWDVFVNRVVGYDGCEPVGLGSENPVACPGVDEPVTSNSAWVCVNQLPPIG